MIVKLSSTVPPAPEPIARCAAALQDSHIGRQTTIPLHTALMDDSTSNPHVTPDTSERILLGSRALSAEGRSDLPYG